MVRADAQRNREKVLVAAREAFARDGLGVPLDEIARAAGVGAGTVHRHFPTKESLYEAVLADRMASLVARAREHAEDGEGLFVFLRAFPEQGGGNRALAEALASGGVDVHARLASLSAELKDAVGDLLRSAQAAGTARADITPSELLALLAGVHLAAEQAGGGESVAVRLLDVLAAGLRA